MDDAAGVGVPQCGGDLAGVTHQLLNRQRPAPQLAPQRLAAQHLHDDADGAVAVDDVMDGGDVGVIELRRGARLPQQLARVRRVEREVGRQHLDRDVAFEAAVVGDEDAAHAAAADRTG